MLSTLDSSFHVLIGCNKIAYGVILCAIVLTRRLENAFGNCVKLQDTVENNWQNKLKSQAVFSLILNSEQKECLFKPWSAYPLFYTPQQTIFFLEKKQYLRRHLFNNCSPKLIKAFIRKSKMLFLHFTKRFKKQKRAITNGCGSYTFISAFYWSFPSSSRLYFEFRIENTHPQ